MVQMLPSALTLFITEQWVLVCAHESPRHQAPGTVSCESGIHELLRQTQEGLARLLQSRTCMSILFLECARQAGVNEF